MNDQSKLKFTNLKRRILICFLSSASLTAALHAQEKEPVVEPPKWATPVTSTGDTKSNLENVSAKAIGLFEMPVQNEAPALAPTRPILHASPSQNSEISTSASITVVTELPAPAAFRPTPAPAVSGINLGPTLSDPLPISKSVSQPVMRDRLITPAGNTEPQLLDPNSPNIPTFPADTAPRMSPPKASVFETETNRAQIPSDIPGTFPSDNLEIPAIEAPQPVPVPVQHEPAPFGQSLQFEKPAAADFPPAQQPVAIQSQTTYDPPSSNFDNSVHKQRNPDQRVAVQEAVHEVQPGENYWTISRKHFGTARYFAALAEYNRHRIPRPDRMKPGMFVLVPETEVLEQRYPTIAGIVDSKPSPESLLQPGFFIGPNNQPLYRIGKGDTLTEIAETHLGRTARWTQIVGMNRDLLRDGNNLKIGMVLRLPHDASQVNLVPPVE